MRLSIRRVLRDTFLIPGKHPREFLGALALPALLIVLITLGVQLTRGKLPLPVGLALNVVYAIVFTILAVACHRLVLLGPSPETLAPRLQWGRRETRFFAWLIALGAIYIACQAIALTLAANVSQLMLGGGWVTLRPVEMPAGELPKKNIAWDAVVYVAYVLTAYIVARCSLVLPTTALDRTASLRSAWQQSAGHGWRLAIIVGGFPWLLSHGVDLLYRENATLPELIALIVLATFALVLGVIALSLSYQDLTDEQA